MLKLDDGITMDDAAAALTRACGSYTETREILGTLKGFEGAWITLGGMFVERVCFVDVEQSFVRIESGGRVHEIDGAHDVRARYAGMTIERYSR